MQHSFLPPELWLRILYWATFNPAREVNTLVAIPVFDSVTHHETEEQYANTLRVKLNLALVCKWWRDNTREFLYEDVHLRHEAESLANLFEQSKRDCPLSLGYGRYVRKIALPLVRNRPSGPVHGWARKEVPRIIKCCPNLLVLSRYHRDKINPFEPQKHDAPSVYGDLDSDIRGVLSAIRRIDWNSGLMLNQHNLVAGPRVTWFAQSLEALSLSEEVFSRPPDVLQCTSVVRLPRVHTLRVGLTRISGDPRDIYRMTLELPALRRVVLDNASALMAVVDCCLSVWGPQVRVLEIGSDWFMTSSHLSHLSQYFPNVETLHYAGRYMLREPPDREFRKLRLIVWRASQDGCRDVTGDYDLEAGFSILLGEQSKFPSIRKIELHGPEWTTLVSDARFQNVLRLSYIRGVEISCKTEAALALDEAKLKYQDACPTGIREDTF
ncbi:hypothetical protein DFH11DRAFT_1328842 [Phellopilus nigrolimitatus]|nr:hypothetical protein DFH11DRAFT_1328842 [Phellopilus nigrolimitatus]